MGIFKNLFGISDAEQETINKDEVKKEIKIVKTKSDDNRSYHINSDKIKNLLGFVPRRSVEMAIVDLCDAFKKGIIPNSFESDNYFNVKKLKSIKAV